MKKDQSPDNPSRRRLLESAAVATGALLTGCGSLPPLPLEAASAGMPSLDAALRERIRHIIVIYAENRSFNNLFADFPGLQQPLAELPPEAAVQRDRDGRPLAELPPLWKGLVASHQQIGGRLYFARGNEMGGLPNRPWQLRTSDGRPLPSAVITSDLVHRFYQNQMQINGGRNDGFVAWGDTGGLVMGLHHGRGDLPHLWDLASEFTLCDNFFMGAFGGSFLNHQYLIAAEPPYYPDADRSPARGEIALVEMTAAGPRLQSAPDSPRSALDGPPRFASLSSLSPDFYAVNTMGPAYSPSFVTDPHDARLGDRGSSRILPPQDHLTIGDRLSDAGIDWGWYAGGWQIAQEGDGKTRLRADFPIIPNFQMHHQPFNYFRRYAPGTAAREQHLRDAGVGNTSQTNRFLADIEAGRLPPVSFYKPQGDLNMHAGYSSVAAGDAHIGAVLRSLRHSPVWEHCMVVVTFDENGGWWDHVAPPAADRWGPGSRIPALVFSPHARKGHVDHTVYDTGSVQRLINRRFGLAPLRGILQRDAAMLARTGVLPGDLTAALDLG